MPWIWKNMAKPIFQYFFVTTVRKITIRYFSLLAGLALTNPMLKLWVKVNWNADNRSILVCLDWNQDWIDYMSRKRIRDASVYSQKKYRPSFYS